MPEAWLLVPEAWLLEHAGTWILEHAGTWILEHAGAREHEEQPGSARVRGYVTVPEHGSVCTSGDTLPF